MANTLKGVFQITGWDEIPYVENDNGAKQSHAKITQDYTGGIKGSSELQYLMSYQSSTSAVFVGFETVSGSINGKSGHFVLQHDGKFENGVASSRFEIVPNSGTQDLADLSGSGSFKSGKNGQANYTLTLKI